MTGAASLRTLFEIWSKPVGLVIPNLDSNLRTLDDLFSANSIEDGSRLSSLLHSWSTQEGL